MRGEQIAERITPKTHLISLSQVSYKTGAYLKGVREIAAAARKAGVVLSIVATQALGRYPVSLGGVDYLMSSNFK